MIYQITYNESILYSVNDIHAHITTMYGVTDWWHYLHNVYLIDTNTLSAKQIADSIKQAFPNLTFFIVKVDINEYNGVLNKDAWNWLARKTKKNVPLKKIKLKTKPLSQSEIQMKALQRAIENLKKNK